MLSPAPLIDSFVADDGYRFACRRWHVDNPLGHVVVVHGIISHSGWYLKTGARLAKAGFAVHSLDRRGSGLNFASRGDVDHSETWVRDLERYLESLGSDSPRLLIGISWGGLLATTVARRRPDLVAGLGLLCPGFFARKGIHPVQHHVVRVAARCGLAQKKFAVPLRDPQLFTGSPWWRRYIRDDPFTLRMVTLRLATASADLHAETIRNPEGVSVPTLLMLAENDALIKNDDVRRFFNRFSTTERRSVEVADAAHTLEFEDDVSCYLSNLDEWCRQISASASKPRAAGR